MKLRVGDRLVVGTLRKDNGKNLLDVGGEWLLNPTGARRSRIRLAEATAEEWESLRQTQFSCLWERKKEER